MILAVRARQVHAEFMSGDAATLAIIGVLWLGIYGAKWRVAEREKVAARARLAAAGKGAWHARRVIAVVVVFVLILIDMWLRGKGRG